MTSSPDSRDKQPVRPKRRPPAAKEEPTEIPAVRGEPVGAAGQPTGPAEPKTPEGSSHAIPDANPGNRLAGKRKEKSTAHGESQATNPRRKTRFAGASPGCGTAPEVAGGPKSASGSGRGFGTDRSQGKHWKGGKKRYSSAEAESLWAEIEDIAQLMRKLIALKAKKHKEEALLAREARKLESLEAKRLAEAVPQPPPSNLAVAMAALAGAEEHRDDPEGERESGDGEDPGTPGSPPNP